MTHFTENARKISSVLKRGHDIGHTPSAFMNPMAPLRWLAVQPGGDHGAAGSADGRIDMGAVEAHPLLGKIIEIRRKAFGHASESSQGFRVQIVRGKQ